MTSMQECNWGNTCTDKLHETMSIFYAPTADSSLNSDYGNAYWILCRLIDSIRCGQEGYWKEIARPRELPPISSMMILIREEI